MTREVKKGMTIIHTAGIGIQNINGCRGVSAYGNRFRVDISIGHNEKKYLVGCNQGAEGCGSKEVFRMP